MAPVERFDLNEIELIRAGLTLVAQMTDEQRELARTQGLPYLLMSPLQGFVFLGAAQERGIPLREGDQASWRFRAVDEFSRQRQAAGWAEVGTLRMTFDYSPSATRTAELAIRVPAFERPGGSE